MLKKIFLVLLALAVMAGGGAWYGWQQIQSFANQTVTFEDQELLTVSRGTSTASFLRQLANEDKIKDLNWSRYWLRLEPGLGNIKAGTYQVAPGLTLRQTLELLIEGKEHSFVVRLVEGQTFKQWREILEQHPVLENKLAEMSTEQILAEVGSKYQHPEGVFFPDTYLFVKGTSDLEILQRAHRQMEQELAASWQQRADKLPYKEPYQALIMASIVEKETGQADERPLIAGVFVNRLHKRMRLQTDPTVIYGIGEDFDGRIRYKHLRTDTPYNTYTRHGLPPTPIAMPGKAAIDAALNPAKTDYLYFVSRGDGSHYFSRTLKEHNRAVDKYIRGKK